MNTSSPQIARFKSSALTAIFVLAAVPGARAQDGEALAQDGSVADARTIWYVASNGVDSPGCGRRSGKPCRTISQGIINSAQGDLVLVRPGLYGDVNGSCTFDSVAEEGEEFGNALCNSPTRICLNKGVTIASTDGAEATVIDACGYSFGVVVLASDSRIGFPRRGFTIMNATSGSVAIGGSSVTVAGNFIRPSPTGNGIQVESGQDHLLAGNLVHEGASGFLVLQHASVGVRVTDNVAISNNRAGFRLLAPGTLATRNRAIGNDVGFEVLVNGQILRGNSIIGNRHYGILLRSFTGTSVTIRRNNIFGNNNVPATGNVNCGILNSTNLDINATDNFWGASSGPGPNPGDEACDVGGGQLVVTPFASTEFRPPVVAAAESPTPGND